MLFAAIASAMLLLIAIAFVIIRAMRYIERHPEVLFNHRSPPSYQRCHVTLTEVVTRYKQIAPQIDPQVRIIWQSPSGREYLIDRDGICMSRAKPSGPETYCLTWPMIGGVGVRMQPDFEFLDRDHDGATDNQVTSGYSFHLLIVPISGKTMDIILPTSGSPPAVDFAAYVLAMTEHMGKRINVFGFDKPPAPPHQRVSKT